MGSQRYTFDGVATIPPPSLSRSVSLEYKTRFETNRPSGAVEQGAYGERMAGYMHLHKAASISVKTKQKATLAVTRLRSESAFYERSASIPVESAFLVNLQLLDGTTQQWWSKDKPRPTLTYAKGGIGIINLEQGPTMLDSSPMDCLQFYVPRTALDEIADENGANRIQTLICPQGHVDEVGSQFASTLLEAMRSPDASFRPFLDHALPALLAHFARVYGGMRPDTRPVRGGLAPWQMRRAVEMLMANLEGEACMSQVARECELSVSYFVRAFKHSVGVPPYRWLTEQRVKLAKNLLMNPSLPMAGIAIQCGFADQACFIRAFKRTAQTTPGEWRRAQRQ